MIKPSVEHAEASSVEEQDHTVLGDVIAIEIVWMPADADEPLSSIAVELRVPDVIRLDEAIAGPLA